VAIRLHLIKNNFYDGKSPI